MHALGQTFFNSINWPQLLVFGGVVLLGLMLAVAALGRAARSPDRASRRPPAETASLPDPTELELKLARLEHLLRCADERITHLHQLVEKTQTRRSIAPSDSPIHFSDPKHSGPASVTARAGATIEEPDPLRRDIYQLADAGHSPLQIAQKLHEHLGKVELILALRRS